MCVSSVVSKMAEGVRRGCYPAIRKMNESCFEGCSVELPNHLGAKSLGTKSFDVKSLRVQSMWQKNPWDEETKQAYRVHLS